MNFTPHEIDLIIQGKKTQVRFVVQDGDVDLVRPNAEDQLFIEDGHAYIKHRADETREITCVKHNDHIKWRVGCDYAVCEGVGKPGAWWNIYHKMWAFPEHDASQGHGWRPLRLRILNIRQEYLWKISEEDAEAEGATPELMTGSGATAIWSYQAGYIDLWNATHKDVPFADNPLVWVISFGIL